MTYRNFALTPLGKPVVAFAVLLATLLPLVVAGVAVLRVPADAAGVDVLPLARGQALVALLVLAVVLPLWRRQAAFDGERLRVRATWFSRESPVSEFRLDQARVLDLREHQDVRPRLKTMGYRLPGFWGGHFRLRDGRRAFCLVSDPAKVLMLPHADGGVWLLSLQHPQAVLDILRRSRA
ncbi:MAG TPA: hypothetical protein VFQ84_00650 [Arenimonas sp.]|uniref:hypothetical protein n=1 Tax=Arenimonas sp. TaxID=1872635 RepID=UPI002D7E700D|nr:hypothetical protein [Arenimonas sp.]HEU0151831.1 hypothetical protein [Arenimonas sp.]